MSEPNYKHEQIQAIKKRLNDARGELTIYKLTEDIKEKTEFTNTHYNTVQSTLNHASTFVIESIFLRSKQDRLRRHRRLLLFQQKRPPAAWRHRASPISQHKRQKAGADGYSSPITGEFCSNYPGFSRCGFQAARFTRVLMSFFCIRSVLPPLASRYD